MTDTAEKAANLTQSEIMDKLTAMQEEMFLTGYNSALKEVYPILKSTSMAINRLATDVENLLKNNDPEFAKELEEREAKAGQLSDQFTNRVLAGLEPNASTKN
jgi:hypothetical protein